MKIRMSKKEILAAVGRVQGVVERRNTMPILANILLRAEGDHVSFFATDLEISIEGSFPAQVQERGAVTLPARRLLDILRETTDDTIDLETSPPAAGADPDAPGWILISSGRSQFKLPSLPPKDFPPPPIREWETTLALPSSTLSELFRKTAYATGENDTKYILSGVSIQVEGLPSKDSGGRLRMVASDGHRLVAAETDVASPPSGTRNVVISKKGVVEIQKLLGEGDGGDGAPTLYLSKWHAGLQWGKIAITARLMEGTYPEYRKFIPASNNRKVVLTKAEFDGALRRVALLAREKTYGVRLDFDESQGGRIVLTSHNSEFGEATEEIPAGFEGESVSAIFNAKYLREIIGAIDGKEVILEFKDGVSAFLIREDAAGFLAVIMPMRS